MKWTAINLIEKIFEFERMTPENEWCEQIQKNNMPRLIRLRRIKALLFAFGIIQFDSQMQSSLDNSISILNLQTQDLTKTGILSILHGDFIKKKDLTLYRNSILFIEENEFTESKPIDIHHLKSFYYHLIQYRNYIYNTLTCNSGVLEASTGFFAANKLIKETNDKVRENVKTVDEFLIQIIDPEKKEFSEQELIDNYNFPKDDLLEIDIDNM